MSGTRSARSTARLARSSSRSRPRRSQHAGAVMPGFTHLQTAQPITFGHHLLAYVEMLARDRGRFADAAKRLNESPLGAAALAGTPFPIDREATARALGFAQAVGEFARRGVGSRLRARDAGRGVDLRHASVAARRGDRQLDLAAMGLRAALRQIHHRLLDHAAEAEPRRGRAGARQDRAHRRRLPGAADGDEGPAARLCQGHARGQGAGVRRARCAEARHRRHDRHGRRTSSPTSRP